MSLRDPGLDDDWEWLLGGGLLGLLTLPCDATDVKDLLGLGGDRCGGDEAVAAFLAAWGVGRAAIVRGFAAAELWVPDAGTGLTERPCAEKFLATCCSGV